MSLKNVETVFCFNDASYPFDVRDAEYMSILEDALEKLSEAEKNVQKVGKGSEIIIAQCDMLKDFFDDCFGEGAGIDICTEKSNIATHYEAYDAFLSFVREQKDNIIESKNTFNKYSNRDQRRKVK